MPLLRNNFSRRFQHMRPDITAYGISMKKIIGCMTSAVTNIHNLDLSIFSLNKPDHTLLVTAVEWNTAHNIDQACYCILGWQSVKSGVKHSAFT